MKRSKFIISTGLGAIAIGLAPSSLIGNLSRPNTVAINLPATSSQIRHGIFSLDQTSYAQLDDYLKIYGKQIFYKNGIEKGDADLVSINFEMDGEEYRITSIGERVFIGDNELFPRPGEKLKIIEKKDKTVFFLQGNDLDKKQIRIAGFLVPFCGEIILDDERLKEDVAIELNESIHLSSKGNFKLLIIENKKSWRKEM